MQQRILVKLYFHRTVNLILSTAFGKSHYAINASLEALIAVAVLNSTCSTMPIRHGPSETDGVGLRAPSYLYALCLSITYHVEFFLIINLNECPTVK